MTSSGKPIKPKKINSKPASKPKKGKAK